MNRGVAKRSAPGHGALAAIAGYDVAIAIREGLREALGAEWPAPWGNDPAIAYFNRGLALLRLDDRPKACDYARRAESRWLELARVAADPTADAVSQGALREGGMSAFEHSCRRSSRASPSLNDKAAATLGIGARRF
jgi:hypothetical protein